MKNQLSSFCIGIYDCEHKTAPLSDAGYPSIRTPNIGKGRLILEGVNLVSEETWQEWTKRAKPEPDDLILAREAPAGNVALVPKNLKLCLGQRTVLIKPNKKLISPHFLCYYLLSPKMQHELLSRSGGSTVPHVNVKDIKNLNLHKLPLLTVQQRIASILSAYDDLIENNLKRVKLLEELAQRTYDEWFVKFRVNGRQLKVDKKTGLPEGWERKKLNELIGYEIGGGWGEDEYSQEFSKPGYVVRGTDIDKLAIGDNNNVPYRFHKESNMASRKIIAGDIVFEVSGGSSNEGVGKTLLFTTKLLDQFNDDVMCASFCKLVRPIDTRFSVYLFLTLKFLRKVKTTEIWEIRSASNIVNYNWTAFLKYQDIYVPDSKHLSYFNKLAIPIFDEIYSLGSQNRLLKESRDILLPRLMSGEIEVNAQKQ